MLKVWVWIQKNLSLSGLFAQVRPMFWKHGSGMHKLFSGSFPRHVRILFLVPFLCCSLSRKQMFLTHQSEHRSVDPALWLSWDATLGRYPCYLWDERAAINHGCTLVQSSTVCVATVSCKHINTTYQKRKQKQNSNFSLFFISQRTCE